MAETKTEETKTTQKDEKVGAAKKVSESRKNKSEKWKNYEINGNMLIRKTKFCPKCGPGVFMGKHKDRFVCGICKYTEFLKKQ